MRRLTAETVFCALVTAWRFAACPTRRSPVAGNPTIEGVVRAPSELGMMRISILSEPAFVSTTATHEFVVPRSIPMTFPIAREPLERRRPRGRCGAILPLSARTYSGFSGAWLVFGLATTTMAARTRRSACMYPG
jgi:hypothetical protein